MTETVDSLVVSQERRDRAHKDGGMEEGVVKVAFVHPASLRNGQTKGGVERETS